MRRLGPDAARVQVLFVTVDPERDTPELLSHYVTAFDPSFLGLCGDADATARTAKEFKILYQKQPGRTPDTLHDGSLGRHVRVRSEGRPAPVRRARAGRRRVRARHPRAAAQHAQKLPSQRLPRAGDCGRRTLARGGREIDPQRRRYGAMSRSARSCSRRGPATNAITVVPPLTGPASRVTVPPLRARDRGAGRRGIVHLDRDVAERAAELVAVDAVVVGELEHRAVADSSP